MSIDIYMTQFCGSQHDLVIDLTHLIPTIVTEPAPIVFLWTLHLSLSQQDPMLLLWTSHLSMLQQAGMFLFWTSPLSLSHERFPGYLFLWTSHHLMLQNRCFY